MFFGLFDIFAPSKPKRAPKRKAPPFKGAARKGYLNHGGLVAKTARGQFAGRVRLQRSPLVEYPTADQLIGIARQYGIPKEATVRAFGHMMKEPGNKAAYKAQRRSPRRKVSRRTSSRRTGARRNSRRSSRRSSRRKTSRRKPRRASRGRA